MNKSAFFLIILLLAGCATDKATLLPPISGAETITKTRLLSLDFKPVSGVYAIKCAHFPCSARYLITAKIDKAVSQTERVKYSVKANREWWWDPVLLADQTITFPAGSSVGTGSFSLVCSEDIGTNKRYLFGTNLERALVYAVTSAGDPAEGRKEHSVACIKDVSTGPVEPKACVVQKDCPANYWCVDKVCKRSPTSQRCTPQLGCGNEGTCVAVQNNPTKPGGIEIVGKCDGDTSRLPNVECMCLFY